VGQHPIDAVGFFFNVFENNICPALFNLIIGVPMVFEISVRLPPIIDRGYTGRMARKE